MKRKGYVGTYTKRESRGIYSFEYQNGKICNLNLWAQVKNPKYLCFVGEYLASICEFEKGAGVVLFDLKGNKMDEIEFETVSSCYLAFHQDKLYSVNYHEGCVHVIEIRNSKLSLIKRVDIKPYAGAHQIIFWEDKFIVPCLLLDCIFIFDKNFEELMQIPFEKEAGPRHGLLIPDSSYLYVVGELSNCLYVVDLELMKVVGKENLIVEDLELGSKFEHTANENELKNLEPNAASAIRYYDNCLYVSVRGLDVISVLEIDEQKKPKLLKNISSFGKHPRDFVIADHYLLIANRESDNLVLLDLNKEWGDCAEDLQNSTIKKRGVFTEEKSSMVLEGAFEGICVLLSEKE